MSEAEFESQIQTVLHTVSASEIASSHAPLWCVYIHTNTDMSQHRYTGRRKRGYQKNTSSSSEPSCNKNKVQDDIPDSFLDLKPERQFLPLIATITLCNFPITANFLYELCQHTLHNTVALNY